MNSFLKQMKYGPRRILVTGHFGSGKTEFAVSLAFALSAFLDRAGQQDTHAAVHAADTFTQDDTSAQVKASMRTDLEGLPAPDDMPRTMAAETDGGLLREPRLALADLDIENPYFRSRERQDELEAAGVKVYSDPYGGHNGSELQVISASIFAPVQDEGCRFIADCGGDKSGAMILNQFSRHFRDGYQLLSVVNCNRPGTDTVEKAVAQIRDTEEVTGLKVTGLVSNAHLIRYTTPETVTEGWAFTKQVSEVSGVPALCACAFGEIADELERQKKAGMPGVSDMDIFRIGMYMRESYLDKKV